MDIILDTSFILTSVKQKIKLFEDIEKDFPEARIFVPLEAIEELEKIKNDKKNNLADRESAELAVFIIKKYNPYIEPLGTPNVDIGIIRYAIQNKDAIIGTLDRELKVKIKAKIRDAKFLTIKQKRRIRLQE